MGVFLAKTTIKRPIEIFETDGWRTIRNNDS